MFSIPDPPDEPFDPDDSEVEFLGGKYGPFRCGNCIYYNGKGVNCAWVWRSLDDDDCCRRFASSKLKPYIGKS